MNTEIENLNELDNDKYVSQIETIKNKKIKVLPSFLPSFLLSFLPSFLLPFLPFLPLILFLFL